MSRILRNIIFVFLLACAGTLQAQQLKVVEFRADMSMTDATRFPKNDYSGDRCGLIKLGLALPMSDVTFEGDIISTEYKEGEWWIYMPRGSNWLTIKSKSSTYLPLRYEFEGIQSNVTYVMTVEKPSLDPEPEVVREQYLIFQIKPADAVLEVNDQLWTVSAEGTARKFVSFGTYSYRVQAPNYYSETGTVTVDDPKNKKTVPINLRPNFGWVEVKGGNVQGAAVYVDNAYVGKAPCKSEALKSGEHTVRIAKEMYAPYSGKITVSDNETSTLSPTLTADFAKITLSVDADAEIWVNEEKKGTRTWTGNLATGTYRVECRMAKHETTATTIEITDKMDDGQTIPLSAPKPICGSLNVESTPDFAKIYVDGKPMGETPNFISQLLIGQHELKLTKEGYADYVETITVAKSERKQINATLNKTKIQTIEDEIKAGSVEEQEIFQIVEEMPAFPGGEQKLREYVAKNIKYPQIAQETGIQGRVYVGFVIEPDGSVSNVELLRGIGGGCDEEAMRVIESMPKWKPGKHRGKAVRVYYRLPVNFKLE